MYSWTEFRQLVPWLCTTIALSYIAFIHYKLRHSKPKPPINPDIDKHKLKVKHVFKVDKDLEKDKPKGDNKTGVKPKVDKPRGRRSAYSYFVNELSDSEVSHTSEEKKLLADFAKKCAHKWKKLSPEEKQHFHQLSELDRIRYVEQMKTYRELKKKKINNKKKKSVENSSNNEDISYDPNDDMSSNSAFDLFAKQEMPIVRELMPNINNEEMLNELLKRWNSSGDEIKKKFKDCVRLESEGTDDNVVKDIEEYISDDNEYDCDEEVVDDYDEEDIHSKSSKV